MAENANPPAWKYPGTRVQFPAGVAFVDMAVFNGRLLVLTDAGVFEVIDGVARPLPVLGVEEGEEWRRARNDLAARALAKNTDPAA